MYMHIVNYTRGRVFIARALIYSDLVIEQVSMTNDVTITVRVNKERGKLLRSPVVIAVAAEPAKQPKVMEIENIEAVATAVQNMLLAAEEMGLACMWRTGDAAYDPCVKEWLGLSAEDHLVAFVYVGFPAIPRQERHPTDFAEKTTWIGWDEC